MEDTTKTHVEKSPKHTLSSQEIVEELKARGKLEIAYMLRAEMIILLKSTELDYYFSLGKAEKHLQT